MVERGAEPRVGRREMVAWALCGLVGVWAAWLTVQRFAPNLLLSSAEREIQAVQAQVRHALKDPDSARFGAIWIGDDGKYACGQVNAKNAMGGYVGFSSFMLQRSTGAVEFMSGEADKSGSLQDQLEHVQKQLKFLEDTKKFCGDPR